MMLQPSLVVAAVLAMVRLAAAAPQVPMVASAATALPPNVEIKEDLQYAEGIAREPRRNRLDLYLPTTAMKPPLVMFVHGGSWTGGSKERCGALGMALARSGVACAAINTQLHPFAEPAAMVADCGHALAFLRANASLHGYDGDRLFVMGHSSGAHLASWLALDEAQLAAAGVPRAALRGCIGLSGVYDVRMRHAVVDHVFGTDAAVREAASPFLHAGAGDPPCLLVCGERDIPGLALSARMLEQRLHEHGVAATALELPGRTHVDYAFALGSPGDAVVPRVLEFVRAQESTQPAAVVAPPVRDLQVARESCMLGMGSKVAFVRPARDPASRTLVWAACGADEGKLAAELANVLAARGIAVVVVDAGEAAAVGPATAGTLARAGAELFAANRYGLPARWYLGGAGCGGFVAASAGLPRSMPAPRGRLLFGAPVGPRSLATSVPALAASTDLTAALGAGQHAPALLFVQAQDDPSVRREEGLRLCTLLLQRGATVHPIELARTTTAAALARFGAAGDVLLPLVLAFLAD